MTFQCLVHANLQNRPRCKYEISNSKNSTHLQKLDKYYHQHTTSVKLDAKFHLAPALSVKAKPSTYFDEKKLCTIP